MITEAGKVTNLITSFKKSRLKGEQRHLEGRTRAALLKETVATETMGQHCCSQTLPAENDSQKWQSRADTYCLQLSSTRIIDRWHLPKMYGTRANCMLGKRSTLKGTQLKQLVLQSGQEEREATKRCLNLPKASQAQTPTQGFIFCKHYNYFTTRLPLCCKMKAETSEVELRS